MSHYDLSRMGWQQFEHMVQSLAFAELGNGVRMFGGGSDGRREATFRGAVNFPRGGGGLWNGYGVIQAKYCEKPKNTTDDWRWFMQQVKSELDKWVARYSASDEAGRKRKFPSYFLFATNVALSAVEDKGGVDTFERMMLDYQHKLPLKGWHAWDSTQLRAVIDNHSEVRRTFLEQIVAGDFLASLEGLLPKETAVTGNQLAVHAANELVARQWARIGESGYGDSSKLRLSAIGIDLPCEYQFGKVALGGNHLDTHVAKQVVATADQVCRPDTSGGALGVVIVGGPGQGKSTIAQLIAHNFRIAFIEDSRETKFTAATESAVANMRERLRSQAIPPPSRRRWPIFVDLAKFGAHLNSSKSPDSLLRYISDSIIVAGHPLDPAHLLDWIATWPSCLILDGLDEVPNARVRDRLIAAVSAFLTEASSLNADVFVVATTRPQGYREEFREILDVATASLSEFTETQALEYAENLIALRSQDDPELANRVTERLIVAVHQRLTQKLMTTPLQVTIMTALAERAVDLPTTRYELFDAYYSTIYDREVGKAHAFSKLRKLRSHIDHLHEEAGLRLQSRSEVSDDLLATRELRRILEKRLRHAGFEPSVIQSTTEALLALASDRLVLLVSPHGKFHGFEVRSVQEYMAARALTEGPDEVVLNNLRCLIGSAHWRNTWLLAAGRIMEARQHLAPSLISMIKQANEGSPQRRTILSGSSLASDLYVDGIATDFPAIRLNILSCALELLADTSAEIDRALLHSIQVALAEGGAYESKLLSTLDATMSQSASNVARKLLFEYRHSPDPIGKQAKRSLTGGYSYEKPEDRDDASRAFMLGNYVEALNEGHPPLSAAERQLIELLVGRRPAPQEAGDPGWKSSVFELMRDPLVAQRIDQTVRTLRVEKPDVAHFGTDLLRTAESRRPCAENLSRN